MDQSKFGKIGNKDGLKALTLHLKNVDNDAPEDQTNELNKNPQEDSDNEIGDSDLPVLEQSWPDDQKQTIHVFSIVKVVLTSIPNSNRYNVTIFLIF